MELCVPVIARGNYGNQSIITHRDSGLLYSDPQVSNPNSLLILISLKLSRLLLSVLLKHQNRLKSVREMGPWEKIVMGGYVRGY